MLQPGSLFFPVTPYVADGSVSTDILRVHVEEHLDFPIGAVFAACGTGEFDSLAAWEVGEVVTTVRETVPQTTVVFGATGGPLGHAIECAQRVQDAGSSGLLILAPYAVGYEMTGYVRYLEQVLNATELPSILYSRPGASCSIDLIRLLIDHPRFVGFKDGIGDLITAHSVWKLGQERRGDDFLVLNGNALAEQVERAYAAVGIPRYTSGVFTMSPKLAVAYAQGRTEGNNELCSRLLEQFYQPMDLLRRQLGGSTATLAKAAVRLGGLEVGWVRAPRVDINLDQETELRRLLAVGLDIIGG